VALQSSFRKKISCALICTLTRTGAGAYAGYTIDCRKRFIDTMRHFLVRFST
jgi:hypothetical protein